MAAVVRDMGGRARRGRRGTRARSFIVPSPGWLIAASGRRCDRARLLSSSWAPPFEVVRGDAALPLWRVAHDTSRTVIVRRMSSGRAQDVDVRAASADRCDNSDHGVTRTTPVRYLLPGARIRSTRARSGAYATRPRKYRHWR